MGITEKVISIYPELADYNWVEANQNGVIVFQNDQQGDGDYIAVWNHPTLSKPTQEQLDAVTGE